ncbi:MAG: glucose 1-dehydrogenase [Reyranellaceae bacterium]
MGRVAGKVALITGGASGLGLAAAKLMAAEGAKIVITDIQKDKGPAAASEIGNGAIFLEHNVTSEQRWQEVVAETEKAFGKLHVVVNSAGIGTEGTIEDTSLADFRKMMAINVEGVFLGCKYGIAAMKKHGEASSLVNISSVAGIVSGYQMCAYSASKGAVRMMSKSVALHCARAGYNIRSNSVHPAFISTPMVEAPLAAAQDPDKARKRLLRMVPIGRIGEANDIGYMILYLASDESRFVTGAEMVVDGGCTAM